MDETIKNKFIQAITIGIIIVLLFTTYASFKIDRKLYERILLQEKQICTDNGLELIQNEGNYLTCFDKNTKQTSLYTRTGKTITSVIP